MGSDTACRGVRFSIRSFLGGGVYVNELGFCRSFFVGLLPISVSVPPLCNADGHHLRHYKRNQRMHHRSGCCLSVAGSVESLSHNSNLVGRGRRYRDHSVQMCIADLNLEMQGRYASSADMTVWSVNAGQVGGHVAGVEKRGSLAIVNLHVQRLYRHHSSCATTLLCV